MLLATIFVNFDLVFLFDIIGTIIFALTGSISGIKLKLDWLGIIVFSCIVGIGGGMLRDTIIGCVPVSALQNEVYLLSCIFIGIISILFGSFIKNHEQLILYLDAFGLGVFTAIGCEKGLLFELGSVGIILCGILTATGGGILRDVLSKKIPNILTHDFYATASLIGGIFFIFCLEILCLSMFNRFLFVTVLVTSIRILAMNYNFKLPHVK